MADGPRPFRGARFRATVTAIVTLVVGGGLLVWQVDRVGWHAVVAGLGEIGAGAPLILAIAGARLLLRAFAWTLFFDRPVSIWRVLSATLAGDAAGNLTAFSLVVSEPTKVLYVRDEIPAGVALAAAAAENFFYSLSVAIVIVLGMAALLLAFHISPAVRVAGGVSLAAMALVIGGFLWMAWRKPAVASAALARLPFARSPRTVERVRRLEARTYTFVRENRRRIGAVTACELVFHALSLAETYVTLWLITGGVTLLSAFVLDSVGRVINVAFRFVPLRLGVDEASASAVATAIGLAPAAGLTLALVRRGRLIAWTIPGLLLLVRRGFSMRTILAGEEGS